MGILNDLCKRIYESSAGRINWYPNMWAKIGSRWDKNRITNENLIGRNRVNARGELEHNGFVLVRRLSVWNCPSPPGNDYYQSERGGYFVPATECRKCEHFRKSDARFRFPRCVFRRTDDPKDVAERTFENVSLIVTDATNKANDLLRG